MLLNLSAPAGRLFVGNALFVICCVFYLAWWVTSFRPVNPVTGIKSGWLLLPAAIAGLAGVVGIVWGTSTAAPEKALFPGGYVIVGGIVAFVLLVILTQWLFDRQVTSELLLITLWAALAVAEANALCGLELFSRGATLFVLVAIGVVFVASLVCYVLFYRLDPWPAYWDGMVPLVLSGLVMAGLAVAIAVQPGS